VTTNTVYGLSLRNFRTNLLTATLPPKQE
jgi:hypothetical protein